MTNVKFAPRKERATPALLTVCSALALAVFVTRPVYAQAQPKDPGVRGGLQNTGGGYQQRGIPIPPPTPIGKNPSNNEGLNAQQMMLFEEGFKRAAQLESTCDTCSVPPTGVGDGNPVKNLGEIDEDFPQFHTNSNGLGTRHNGDSCLVCHAQPTLGGSGGFISPAKGVPAQNPSFDLIPHRFGKQNVVPSFITPQGPIREVRFKFNRATGARDGNVHQLWVTTGIVNDPLNTGCRAVQPDFETELAQNNLSFRIPLQLFGLGLIDSIQDAEIMNRHNQTAVRRGMLNIAGHPNLSPNDGTISRFGWKAQNKSITVFAGEAYNVEMGVNNELLPQAVDEEADCANGKPAPNDVTRTDPDDKVGPNHSFFNPLHELADWMEFQIMMRFIDFPHPDPTFRPASAQHGQEVFSTIGCDLCHTPTMMTAPDTGESPVLQNRPANLYSDLLVHHMGPGLADNIIQGAAGPDEFRTTPLWGVGQRIFFLHDGRTSDLLQAILFHESGPANNTQGALTPLDPGSQSLPPSEANMVIENFKRLPVSDQQSILDFLRSL